MRLLTVPVCLFILVGTRVISSQEQVPLSQKEIVEFVNNHPDATWTAATNNQFEDINEFRSLLGAMREPPELKQARRPTIEPVASDEELPENFTSIEKWPKCETIAHIWDQSSCGSCWAFGAASAMSDRVCIHSRQTKIVWLSATDLLSCCRNCGHGCEGGYLGPSWDFWRDIGLATGGDYEQKGTCWPYPFLRCKHRGKGTTYPDCPKPRFRTPTCKRLCDPGTGINYYVDKIKSKTSYNVPKNEDSIKREIFENGPVEAAFDVYEDFRTYEKGVYKHMKGARTGGHAIRIVGWGMADNVPYWLIANSWNEEWGEKGYFRMVRGENDCGIENDVVAGMPK